MMDMKRTRSGICYAVIALLAIGLAFDAEAFSVTKGTQKSRSTYPRGLSGITYVGGDQYYSVCDNGNEIGLYPCTITVSSDGLTINSFSTVATNKAIRLSGTSDLEAVAYDPATGNIWAAEESGKTIKEYNPQTGAIIQSLPIPNVMTKINGNYGFESLTISGDGLTLWTANEEALTVDGSRSSYTNSTIVRLVKYVRQTVNDKFQLAAMYPYTTEKWHNRYALGGSSRRGVADLCALPDGSLLVLERELSSPTDGSDFWAKLDADFYYAIYRVSNFVNVTDIQNYPSLKEAPVVSIQKTLLYDSGAVGFNNYEGICFGKRISDNSVSLLMVTDSGDGNSSSSIIPLVLSDNTLNVRTLSFEEPAGYTASIKGSNYRYLDGAQVSVELTGPGVINSAYTNNGETVATALWAIANQSPASGSGYAAGFTVGGDGTLTWAVATGAAVSPVIANDSFEAYAVGTPGDEITGWSGEDAEVVATNYTLAAGYPMVREAHTKVLSVDGDLTRTYPEVETNDYQKLDMAISVRRAPSNEEMAVSEGDNKLVVASDAEGHLCLRCLTGGNTTNWVQLSNTAYANDAWVRVELTFDYTSNGEGRAFAQVRVDGVECATASGYASPTDLTAGGSWYELLTVGLKPCVSSLVASGMCKLDDVILTIEPKAGAAGVTFEDDGAANLVASTTADTIATYINGLTDATVVKPVTVVTKPMVISWLLGANTVLSTPENAILKITAIEQVEGNWQITVSTELNAADTVAGAVIDLNRINGALKVTATDDLSKPFTQVDGSKFTVVPAGLGSPDVVITVTDAEAHFLKAVITE